MLWKALPQKQDGSSSMVSAGLSRQAHTKLITQSSHPSASKAESHKSSSKHWPPHWLVCLSSWGLYTLKLLNAEEKRNLNKTQNDFEWIAQTYCCPLSPQSPPSSTPNLQISDILYASFQKPEKQSLLCSKSRHYSNKRCLNKHCYCIFGFQSGLHPIQMLLLIWLSVFRETLRVPSLWGTFI